MRPYPFELIHAVTHSVDRCEKESTFYPARCIGGWFLSNLLGIQPLPGYSYVVEEAKMGYLQQSGEKEDMWKNEHHTFMIHETDCTHSPSPSLERNTEKIKKKKH